MEEITPEHLKDAIEEGSDYFLLDVREEEERVHFHIGGCWIPMDDLLSSLDLLPNHLPIVIYCKRGIRSAICIQRLEARNTGKKLLNLKGGLEAWKKSFPEDYNHFKNLSNQ